jgi:hypothetical protein
LLRKGFLPMATTRGDRLFIGLLSAAYINLALVGWAKRSRAGCAGRRTIDLDQRVRLCSGAALVMRRG